MSLTPVNVEGFGGLRLDLDPEEAGWNQAIDLLNVDLNREGRVRTRDGFDNLTASALSQRVWNVAAYPRSSQFITYSDNTTNAVFTAFDSSGTSVASHSMGGIGPGSFGSLVAFGAPGVGTSALYASSARWTGGLNVSLTQARKWDGSAWSDPALGALGLLCLMPMDNRLMSSQVTDSKVSFSGAGAPETFGANDYVYLTPGDGQAIVAMVAWQSQVFVFKQSRFFVFYGNSTDATGNPVFNYRPVDVGIGCEAAGAAVAGPDGVYFLNTQGVYRTTGGPPVKVSDAIEGFFTGATSSLYASSSLNTATSAMANRPRMACLNGRVYVAVPTGVATENDRLLVYDTQDGYWLLHDVAANGMCAFPQSGVVTLLFGYAAGSNHVGKVGSAYTTDDGTAIVSRYRSGFSDVGLPGREKTVTRTELIGQGSPTFAWSRDYGAITSTSTGTVTLGTAPATARAVHQLAQNGELLSWQASATTAWQLNRVTPMLRMPRPVGEKTT